MDNAVKVIIAGACVAIATSTGLLTIALKDLTVKNAGKADYQAPIQKYTDTLQTPPTTQEAKDAIAALREKFDGVAASSGCKIVAFRPVLGKPLINITIQSEKPAQLTVFIDQCRTKSLIDESRFNAEMTSAIQDGKRVYEITYTVKPLRFYFWELHHWL
ncbi:hypothetical protein JXA32_16815 [Candidatus Sumerlaeota bacterium]|nr:hypothetical protein [Candidatus Sumerlaeota bacterium]